MSGTPPRSAGTGFLVGLCGAARGVRRCTERGTLSMVLAKNTVASSHHASSATGSIANSGWKTQRIRDQESEQLVIMHADEGSQYGSDDRIRLCKSHKLAPRRSRCGNCWNNAAAESFFSSPKKRAREERSIKHVIWRRSTSSKTLRCITIEHRDAVILVVSAQKQLKPPRTTASKCPQQRAIRGSRTQMRVAAEQNPGEDHALDIGTRAERESTHRGLGGRLDYRNCPHRN
jgi:transposase InsO family protein